MNTINKPYFAKYVPVEGEIKEEDWIIREWYPPTSGFKREIVQYKSYMKSSLIKKIKLFLCSRDNPKQAQEILTEGIKEGQEFLEQEKDYLTLGSVVEI